jgi:two-component system, cell cycle sensor histidine kinase and response regulator CckA
MTLQDMTKGELIARVNALQRKVGELDETRAKLRSKEQALQDSEDRFRYLFDNAPIGIFQSALDGRLLNVNHAHAHMFGYNSPHDEVTSVKGITRDLWADRDKCDKLLDTILAEGRALNIETEFRRKEGTTFIGNLHFQIVRNDDGSLRYVEGFVADITKRKDAEQGLKDHVAFLQTLLDAIPNPVFYKDVQGRYLGCNRAFAEFLGFPMDQIVGKMVYDLAPMELADIYHGQDLQLFRCRGVQVYESTVQQSSGTRNVIIYKSTFTNADGMLAGLIGIILDITERKAMEELVNARVRQQAAVADLGQRALGDSQLSTLLDKAVEKVAQTLLVEYAKVLELLPNGDELLLRAGVGWKEGLVGHACVSAGADSQAGYTLDSQEPVIVEDLRTETRFSGPHLLHEHQVVSGMSVIIQGRDRPFGVLGAHTTALRKFSRDDVNFLQSVANVLAQGIERKRGEMALRESEARFRAIFEQAAVGVAQIDVASGRFTRINQRYGDIVGYSTKEMGNLTFQAITHPDDFKVDLQKLELLRAGKIREFSVENRHFHKTGSTVWCRLAVSCLWSAGEEPNYCIAVVQDITVAKRVEEALRESERKYRLIFENSPVGIFLYDTTGVITDCNSAMAALMGSSMEKIVGLNLLTSLRNEQVVAMIRAALSGIPGQYEGDYLSVTGSKLTAIKAYYAPHIAEDDSRLGGIGIIEDVTERSHADKALRESENRYRTLIETMNEGLVVVDSRLTLTYVNENFASMLGYSRQEMLGMPAWDFVSETEREVLKEHFAKRRTGEMLAESYELVLKCKEGRLVPVLLSARAIFDEHKRFKGSVVTCIDMTALKRAEEAQHRLAAAVEQSADSIIITDQDRRIQYVNPAFEQISGYTREEAIGRTTGLLKSAEHDKAFYSKLVTTIKRGDPWKGRIVSRRKDGGLFHEDVTISPVFDPTGQIINYVDVGHDVTQQVQLERQLLQAQKMEAVGTLAGGVAHDFNNLLAVILGFSELLLSERDEGDPEYADLQKIFVSAKNGAQLVQQLLTFSRRVEPRPARVNLNSRIMQVQKLLRRTIPRMIDIQLDLSDDLAETDADPTQMDQVLMNLAVNARDAMPDGGRLTIGTTNVSLDQEYCELHVGATPGEYVLLTMSDTGHGIDEATLEHIFEPFFTTKGIGRGTGLGLAMVYGIVNEHKGHITCQSEVGGGTAFKVYLPAALSEVETTVETSDIMPAFGTETILVVDDEEPVRELSVRILTKAGYTVFQASNGKEASDIFRREKSRISLVILDLIMPEMGGKECLRELLKIDPQVKVLVASGYSGDASTKECLETGAKGFVRKPFRMKEFLQQVRGVLDEA